MLLVDAIFDVLLFSEIIFEQILSKLLRFVSKLLWFVSNLKEFEVVEFTVLSPKVALAEFHQKEM